MNALRRLFLLVFITIAVFACAFFGWVFLSQEQMIYHPEPYSVEDIVRVPKTIKKLTYKTGSGKQVAWYVPPRTGSADKLPQRLWLLFGGNASLALHWTDHVKLAPDDLAGFLLIDYPGYGENEGRSSPRAIRESVEASIEELAKSLNVTQETLMAQNVRVLGHSLGAAVALDFAANHDVELLILAAPFTSMKAMADKIAGRQFSWLLSHKFDNVKSLEKLAVRKKQPQVVVLHGGFDMAIPVEMSRELDKRWPELVELVEIPHADHTSVLDPIRYFMAPDIPKPVTTLEEVKQAANAASSDSSDEYTTASLESIS